MNTSFSSATIRSRLTELTPPQLLLATGVALRLVTFVFLDPENVDGHWLVVSFIAQQGRLPHSGELGQAYHPPLYYLLAAPIYRLSGSFKVVQVLSLMLSILTLLVLYRLIWHSGLIQGSSARLYCFALCCFLPQFVLYGLFVSNDSLTIFLGCCTVWCIAEFVRSPGRAQFGLLALTAALGLFTKATFLAYLPVLCLVVFVMFRKNGHSLIRSSAVAFAFALVLVALTSYKEIDNYRQYGHAFISNIDFHPDWAVRQEKTYAGPSSFVNFNLSRLLSSPSYSPSTGSAYPLMLYATFWYQHVPESSFIGSSHRPFTFLAVAIYIAALIPTAVFLIGLGGLTMSAPALAHNFSLNNSIDGRKLTLYAAVGLLAGNLGIMLAALAKYHVCSIMQGRLLFPSFFGLLAVVAAGIEQVERTRWATRLLRVSMSALCVLFISYLSGEIALTSVLRFLPESKEYLHSIAAHL